MPTEARVKALIKKMADEINASPGPQGEKGDKGDQGDPGSDATVTKSAVEAVLTGEISSHSHAGGGGGLFRDKGYSASMGDEPVNHDLRWVRLY